MSMGTPPMGTLAYIIYIIKYKWAMCNSVYLCKAGQLQIIDMATTDETKRSLQKMNDERKSAYYDSSEFSHNL